MAHDFRLVCIENRDLSEDIFLLRFRAPDAACDLVPGHFFMLEVPDSRRAFWLRRPFSVHDWDPGSWWFLVQALGAGTRQLQAVQPGQAVQGLGPLGRPFPLDQLGDRVLLVSGGVGMATLFPLHKALIQKGVTVRHLYGARTRRRLVRSRELQDLGGEVGLATDDGSEGCAGRLDQVLARYPQWWQDVHAIVLCGPVVMMAACWSVLAPAFPGPVLVSMEVAMGCGYGVCRGCAVPLKKKSAYAMACLDGPVFQAGEIDWTCLPSP